MRKTNSHLLLTSLFSVKLSEPWTLCLHARDEHIPKRTLPFHPPAQLDLTAAIITLLSAERNPSNRLIRTPSMRGFSPVPTE